MTNPFYPEGISERDIDRIGESVWGDIIEICSMCNGFGILVGNVTCPTCDGSGKIEDLEDEN